MPRPSRKTQASQSSHMEVDSASEDEQVSVSQVSRSMRRVNVSQNARKGKVKARQVDSDSNDEQEVSRNTQRSNEENGWHAQRGRGNTRQIDSNSDEEPQPSTSQASQKRRKHNVSQSHRAHQLSQASTSRAVEPMVDEEMSASQISPNSSLTEQEYNHHVANVVKYILAANHSNIPIDRTKISGAINCHNKKFKDVFKSAQDILKDVFGLEVVEIKEDRTDENNKEIKQTKSVTKFILVNTINAENIDEEAYDEIYTDYALLFLCLAHIYMNGGKCTRDSLTGFLKRLEIITDNHHNETFENPMETIEKDFVSWKYINLTNDELSWGIRANIELKPRTVMEFASRMYGGRKLDSWPQEYERMLVKEREENQRPNGQVNG